MLFGIKTTIGQEKIVAEMLEGKMKKESLAVLAIAVIPNLRGYIIVETENETELKKLVYKASHAKGVIPGIIQLEEIEHFFEIQSMTQGIDRGDIAEITSGAFKGEKARVIRVDPSKDKVTVEIIEAAVPIPVTVDASSVRVLKRASEEKS